jgi:hypothetical protein
MSAIEISIRYGITEHLATTYISICAVLSELNKHKAALNYAIKGAFQCQEDLLRTKDKVKVISLLAIAFHNMAQEEEAMSNLESAIEWRRKACNVVDNYQMIDVKLKTQLYISLKKTKDKLNKCNTSYEQDVSPYRNHIKRLNLTEDKLFAKRNSSFVDRRRRQSYMQDSMKTQQNIVNSRTKRMFLTEVKKSLYKGCKKPKFNSYTMILNATKKYSERLVYDINLNIKEEIKELKEIGVLE